MGFFTRKREQESLVRDANNPVQVIRSRFYGRHGKLKKRTSRINAAASPKGIPTLREQPVSSAPVSPTNAARDIIPSKPRPASDVITMTLAQRLNELAVANTDGLLDDDEYRLLRQNLFERFASGLAVPAESPIVPVTRRTHRRPENSSLSPSEPSGSNFYISPNRTPSVRSKASVTSTMSNLFRRVTTRKSNLGNSDTSSIFSTSPSVLHSFLRQPSLSRKNSNASFRPEASRTNLDAMSISSRTTALGPERNVIMSDKTNPSTTSLSRSSRRGLPTSPPSSFPSRIAGVDVKYFLSGNSPGVFDADHLTTAADIRKEISSVEGERKRLLDAFNGLEISILTKPHNRSNRSQPVRDAVESTWTIVPDRRPLWHGPGSDSTSVFSSDTSRTAPSLAASPVSFRRHFGSLSPSDTDAVMISPLSTVPSMSHSLAHSDAGSASTSSLARSNSYRALRVPGQGENIEFHDEDALIIEKELCDLRRRRADVMSRYDARLDYLRAKLKSAEIHERLLRK